MIPTPEALPATERRRAGKCVRLALAAGLEAAAAAGRAPRDLVAVFASSGGDGERRLAACMELSRRVFGSLATGVPTSGAPGLRVGRGGRAQQPDEMLHISGLHQVSLRPGCQGTLSVRFICRTGIEENGCVLVKLS